MQTDSESLITHGLRYTYVYRKCRCDECKAANTAYHARYRVRPDVIERELQATHAGREAVRIAREAAIEALI